jgi:hypothetical protein
MAANLNPIFTLTPHIGVVSIATANTGRDGSGTLGSVITGATNGTRVTRITVTASGTTTAGMVRLYIDSGAGALLWKEIPVTAITGSASVAEFSSISEFTGERSVILPNAYILKASTHNAEPFVVIAEGGDY